MMKLTSIPRLALFLSLGAGCMPVLTPSTKPTAHTAAASSEKTETSVAAGAARDPHALVERVMDLRSSRFTARLPCAPKPDKVENDDTELGPMTFDLFDCDDEAHGSYAIFVGRFDRPLAATTSDAAKAKQNALAVKYAVRAACAGLKDAGAKCKTMAPPKATAEGAEGTFSLPSRDGEPPTRARVVARYPYVAVALAVTSSADDAATVLASIKLP